LGLNVVKIGSERHVKKGGPVRRGPEWLDHVTPLLASDVTLKLTFIKHKNLKKNLIITY
jgi:hypothetical protein